MFYHIYYFETFSPFGHKTLFQKVCLQKKEDKERELCSTTTCHARIDKQTVQSVRHKWKQN